MLREKILSTTLTNNQVAIFYLGQEGILIKSNDAYILIDAYLSDYTDRNCCTETVVWRRKYDVPISASELDFVDYVFCTHPHYDHADPDTLTTLNKVNTKATYIVPYTLKKELVSYGITESKIQCMDADEVLTYEGIQITAIAAAHEELYQDADGHACALGYKLDINGTTLFHAGDCCVYDGLAERISNIDIGFLPINGRDYFRLRDDVIGNMDSREAVLLARETGMKILVPMHYDLYDANDVNPAYFVDCLYRFNPNQMFHMFMPGERYIYEK